MDGEEEEEEEEGVVEESEGCEFETLISPSVSPVSNLARRGGRKEEEWEALISYRSLVEFQNSELKVNIKSQLLSSSDLLK